MPRLQQPPDLDWQLDLHGGLSTEQALTEFLQAYDLLLQQPVDKVLLVIHGYGSTGRGGEIYLAPHQLLEHNRMRARFSHPLLDGRRNPGCTRVQWRLRQRLEVPDSLARW